jgi:arginase
VPRPIAVLDAPSNLGLSPPRAGAEPGAWKLARSLRDRGLVQRLRAEDAGALAKPPYSPEPHPENRFRNGAELVRFSRALAARTRELVSAGRFPVVLGGDCSVLLGNMAGLRGLGRYGLVFLDGHDDFSPPRDVARPLTAAGQDLALVTGHGPDSLTRIDGSSPLVREEDVALVGMYRDPTDARDFDVERLERTAMARWPIERVRALGARATAEQVRSRMEALPLDGFWVHLDADVLDQSVMSAVDSPNPKGLHADELGTLLAILLASPKAAGLQVTIYDPERDPTGAAGDLLADVLTRAVAAARGPALEPILEAPTSNGHPALMLYGQFIGDWDLRITHMREDGTSTQSEGETRWRWILDGRAIQDIWRAPRGAAPGERQMDGTTVRLHSPTSGTWSITWHSAVTGLVQSLEGRQVGPDILQEGTGPDGLPTRWVFSDISADRFVWRALKSRDGGKSWQQETEMVATRRAAP